MLGHLLRVMDERRAPLTHTWRARAIGKLLNAQPGSTRGFAPLQSAFGSPTGQVARVQRMMLPLSAGSPATADVMTPLLQPLGLAAIHAAPGTIAGHPPPGIDVEQLEIQPGSVLTIPLAFGDLDISISGTATDVMPDGRVLAFGHALFGLGDAHMPMANGFVHFVQPSNTISFKLSGSGQILGGVVRDEQSGIVGKPDGTFGTAPVNVTVNMPSQPSREYKYQVVHNRQMLPVAYRVPTSLLLRDYHVGNLMHLPRRQGVRACGLLDFQDAGLGPVSYDLVSLLEDARRDMPAPLRRRALARYGAAFPKISARDLECSAAVMATMRHFRVIAVFLRLARDRGRPEYLVHLPRLWRSIDDHLPPPALAPLGDWLRQWCPPERRAGLAVQ